jgi:hypothetical protein
MKSCPYCGKENGDDRIFCLECGTQFPEPSANQPSKKPYGLAGIKSALLVAVTISAVFALYLLSFGPVNRWCSVRTPAPPPVTLTNQSTTILVVSSTVSYPSWVGVVYYPALHLLSAGRGDGLGALYAHYLSWWENPSDSER